MLNDEMCYITTAAKKVTCAVNILVIIGLQLKLLDGIVLFCDAIPSLAKFH